MNEKGEPTRQPIANELLGRFAALADRAQALAQRTTIRLEPIMRQAALCTEECEATEEQYPPILAEYRNKLYEIENAIARIEECLDRVEV